MKRNWFYFTFAGAVALALLAWTTRQAFKSLGKPKPAPEQSAVDKKSAIPPPAPAVEMHRFSGAQGPTNISKIPELVPTDWRRYSTGGTNRLAVLLTDTNSAWLGLAHGLRTIGVPFLLTTNTAHAPASCRARLSAVVGCRARAAGPPRAR